MSILLGRHKITAETQVLLTTADRLARYLLQVNI